MAKTEVKPEAQENHQELVEVTLLKDHTHNGELCKASSTIRVNAADRNFLRAHNII